MKIQAKDKLLIQLHKIIGKVGKIAVQDNDNMNNLLKIGIWDEETVLEWAKNFAEDPWRVQNKAYRTVAHFLRDPEKWDEPKTVKEEDPWTL